MQRWVKRYYFDKCFGFYPQRHGKEEAHIVTLVISELRDTLTAKETDESAKRKVVLGKNNALEAIEAIRAYHQAVRVSYAIRRALENAIDLALYFDYPVPDAETTIISFPPAQASR